MHRALVLAVSIATLNASAQSFLHGKPRRVDEQIRVLEQLADVDPTAEQTATIIGMKKDVPAIHQYLKAIVKDRLRSTGLLPERNEYGQENIDRTYRMILGKNQLAFLERWVPSVPESKVIEFRKWVLD